MALGGSSRNTMVAQANARASAGDYPAAVRIYRKLLKSEPRNPDLLFELGKAEALGGDARGARKHLQQAIKIEPSDPRYHCQLALSWKLDGRQREGHRAADKALKLQGDHPFALWVKAELLRVDGEHEAAYELLRPAVDAGTGDTVVAVVFAMVADRFEGPQRSIELLEGLREHNLEPVQRAQVLFQLGTLLDKVERYDDAFAAFAEANGIVGRGYDVGGLVEQVDRRIVGWSAERLAALPRAAFRTDVPVFIVGMMRSGTSLIEQILACHPDVHGAGETTALRPASDIIFGSTDEDIAAAQDAGRVTSAALDRATRRYLDAVRRGSGGAARVTDKMMYNFRLLGLIDIMFPDARVIHAMRSPLDTCLSCYFHNFTGAHRYAYDLEHLGAYAREYVRIMDHWKAVVSIPILEVRYEQLVADQEDVTRRMIDFLGLPWDPACLHFHESKRTTITWSADQVRQPMYASSVERWRNNERHLAPLIEALGPLAE